MYSIPGYGINMPNATKPLIICTQLKFSKILYFVSWQVTKMRIFKQALQWIVKELAGVGPLVVSTCLISGLCLACDSIESHKILLARLPGEFRASYLQGQGDKCLLREPWVKGPPDQMGINNPEDLWPKHEKILFAGCYVCMNTSTSKSPAFCKQQRD